MEILIIVIMAIVIIALVITNLKNKDPKDDNLNEENLPYIKKYLLTKNEWIFYKKIKPICDKYKFHIIAKVRLADIVEVKKGLDNKERQKYFNKIKNKHIDFVICNPENLAIIGLIELDDRSHENKERIKSDNFKDKLSKTVGYKLIRVKQNEDFEKLLIENNIVERTPGTSLREN